MAESQICKFYDGQNVLVTGGTGFMGKILVEKLLRSTDVATIFLLIREKKGKNVHTRLDDIFDNVVSRTGSVFFATGSVFFWVALPR
jgi:fatty acyl-CoA reductase